MQAATAEWPLELRIVPGRGRGLFAARDIAAGETVLAERPLLLVVSPEYRDLVCTQCLRGLGGTAALQCSACSQARFCSEACLQQSQLSTGNHPPLACRSASMGPVAGLDSDEVLQLNFLLRALALRQAAASDADALQAWNALLSVVGDASPDMELPVKLHQALCSTAAAAGLQASPAMTLEEVAALIKKDDLNSYGVMAPSGDGGERRIRGCGVYVHSSLVNHECLPNVARYDSFDSPGAGNTVITIRSLHAIPAGSEVLQSYFPLNWSYSERQERCKQQYGFECCCPRCLLESKWGPDDEEEADEREEDEDPEESVQDTYQYLFIMKHMCPQTDCFGTMAPEGPGSSVYECNMCGHKRTEAEFMAELNLQQRGGP
mmetsp:Transcript_2950/g.8310  ORF Transcript_2950/g.8310 Transcript_2950/m.8310 type:complete len:377 (+) Transcript_2950:228-1358(+)